MPPSRLLSSNGLLIRAPLLQPSCRLRFCLTSFVSASSPLPRSPLYTSMFRTFRQLFSTTPSPQRQAAMAAVKDKVQKLIDDNVVIVFSKSYCPYCNATKKTLDGLGADYTVVELDKESEGAAMQDELEDLTGQRTVPNVIINKKPIGGNSDVQSMFKSGELTKLLKEVGSLKA